MNLQGLSILDMPLLNIEIISSLEKGTSKSCFGIEIVQIRSSENKSFCQMKLKNAVYGV